MNIFEKLLEIKTAKKNLSLKAIYIKHPIKKLKWSFYIYYYNQASHSFYINWLDKKTISESALEEVINRAFKKESKRNKKPLVFYFSKQDDFIYIDKVELKAIKSPTLEIEELKINKLKLFS